ncbi:MAG: hypothetical protein ABIJ85_03225 [bacterium]
MGLSVESETVRVITSDLPSIIVDFPHYEESGGLLPENKYQALVEFLHSTKKAESFPWTLAQVNNLCSSTRIPTDDELRFLYVTLREFKKLYPPPSPSDQFVLAECLIISGRLPDLATLKAHLPNIFK